MTGAAARAAAAAKINLSLVVGPRRQDGLHPVATVMQRIDLSDRLELGPARELEVVGYEHDTLVRASLERLAAAAGVEPRWRVHLEKAIPVAAGLGGGSADAACALTLANRLLPTPLPAPALASLAAGLGADVPFFLEPGPKLAEGAGERLTPVRIAQDYWVVVALDPATDKPSTAVVYRRFDEQRRGSGFEERRALLLSALRDCGRAPGLASLPGNDLAPVAGSSDLAARLASAGAFRADVSGAGPAAYGLFLRRRDAERAARELPAGTRRWVVTPVW